MEKINATMEKFNAMDNKKKLTFLGIVAGGLVLILALVLILSSIFGSSPKKAVSNYFDATVKYKTGKIDDLAPKAVWEYLEDEEDISIKDIKEGFDEARDDLIDEAEDNFGKNYKVKYKIVDQDELSKKDLKELAKAIDEMYDGAIKKSDVKKAYKLDIEGEIKGSEDDEEIDMEDFIVVKIKGKWYPVNSNGSFYASMFAFFATDFDAE